MKRRVSQKDKRPVSTRRGDGWTGRFSTRALSGAWGYCDYDRKEIVISPETLKEGNTREIILHEVLHKILPCMTEEWVLFAAQELDYALEQLLPDDA